MTMTAIIPTVLTTNPLAAIPTSRVSIAQAIAALLALPNPNTRRNYAAALETFAEFIGESDGPGAALRLLGLDHGQANLLAMQYQQSLIANGLAAPTINLKIAALSSASKLARRLGAINWTLEVSAIPVQTYRDTAGPGIEAVRDMLRATANLEDPRMAARDVAIISLCCELGLRRQSVCDLDLEHIDFQRNRISVKLKGRHDRETFFLPGSTWKKLTAWVGRRGGEPGPLFFALDPFAERRGQMRRLGGQSIRLIVKRAGERVGVRARPHGLRHTGATAVATESGSAFEVQSFLRHKSVQTSQKYIDNLDDLGVKAATRVAEQVGS